MLRLEPPYAKSGYQDVKSTYFKEDEMILPMVKSKYITTKSPEDIKAQEGLEVYYLTEQCRGNIGLSDKNNTIYTKCTEAHKIPCTEKKNPVIGPSPNRTSDDCGSYIDANCIHNKHATIQGRNTNGGVDHHPVFP